MVNPLLRLILFIIFESIYVGIGSIMIDLGYKDKWLITTYMVLIMGFITRCFLCSIIEA